MRTNVIIIIFLSALNCFGNVVCESYVNTDHELHFEHSSILKFSPEEIPLDSIFYNPDNTPITLTHPFIWLIKDQTGQPVGALIGTAHKYVSIDMMPKVFFEILRQSSVVMTEHSSRQNGELDLKLMRPGTNRSSVFSQLPTEDTYRINSDFINFNRIKREVARRLASKVFFPRNEFSITNLSTYGFFMRQCEVAEMASSELRTQPIQMDDQIGRLATSHGVKWRYLEDGVIHLHQYVYGHTLTRIKQLLSQSTNIFEVEYFNHRYLLKNYRDGNLEAIEAYIETLTDLEREYFLSLRNRAWIPRIIQNLKSEGFTTIAAGIYHFVGEDNVIQLLEAEGYKAERLQIQ